MNNFGSNLATLQLLQVSKPDELFEKNENVCFLVKNLFIYLFYE